MEESADWSLGSFAFQDLLKILKPWLLRVRHGRKHSASSWFGMLDAQRVLSTQLLQANSLGKEYGHVASYPELLRLEAAMPFQTTNCIFTNFTDSEFMNSCLMFFPVSEFFFAILHFSLWCSLQIHRGEKPQACVKDWFYDEYFVYIFVYWKYLSRAPFLHRSSRTTIACRSQPYRKASATQTNWRSGVTFPFK